MQSPSENAPLKARLTSWLRPGSWSRKVNKAPSILPTSSDESSGKGETVNESIFQTAGGDGLNDDVNSPEIGTAGALSSDAATDNEKHTATTEQRPIIYRFCQITYTLLFSTRFKRIFNCLLFFLPAGITIHFLHVNDTASFVCNALAILPLANLLTIGTESLSQRLGSAYGALVNVTMGNSVELIIFIIAIYKNELRIVQASLIGSILANLLAIFGLSVLVGGLVYKEQSYNSTVSQMSAVLLGLCVLTLLLPTAFYNAFKQSEAKTANKQMLKFSRGTSCILLCVYGAYLYFQLKSHKHLYVGTPQHILDEEAAPGPLADWFDSSSDSSDSDSDSDTSSASSAGAVARLQNLIRKRGKRASSNESANTVDSGVHVNDSPFIAPNQDADASHTHGSSPTGGENSPAGERQASYGTKLTKLDRKERKRQKRAKKKEKKERKCAAKKAAELLRLFKEAEKAKNEAETRLNECRSPSPQPPPLPERTTHFVAFQERTLGTAGRRLGSSDNDEPTKSKFSAGRPGLLSNLSTGLMHRTAETTLRPPRTGLPNHTPRIYGVHRSDTAPSSNFTRIIRHSNELTRTSSSRSRATTVAIPPYAENVYTDDAEANELSKAAAITLLCIATALVAVCAYGLVESIEEVTKTGGVISEAFVGLIIVPLVGNAAEHFTAVRMAQTNKMDLTIGIAVGSSIQIALFVTPAVVLIAWTMGKSLSLYFTLFETVSLFASAFIVNFLILDGKSNYMEGVIMLGAYIIIGLAACFYPPVEDLSALG